MNTYPLIRAKWSNEHIMAAVLLVLILYHIPQWVDHPADIVQFLLLVGVGLVIDAVADIIRYRRLWCCVSGAVTAAIVSLLSGDVPLRGKLIGVVAALIVGKHIQGGTGKNKINPAMIGVSVIVMFFGVTNFFFEPSMLLLPAIILGLLFLTIRPYAGIALMLGMLLAMHFNHDLSYSNVMAYGVLFWGCLIATDPVTVTPHRLVGAVLGFVTGFLPMLLLKVPSSILIGFIIILSFSGELANLFNKSPRKRKARMHIAKAIPYCNEQTAMIDLTKKANIPAQPQSGNSNLSKEEIWKRIKVNEVFGMGGAAFSTYEKIMTVVKAETAEKHLIINGVECDPGLIHDVWLLRNHFNEIIKGVDLLQGCMEFSTIHLAVKDKSCLVELQQVKDKSGLAKMHQVKLYQVKDLYPIGAEKVLIQEVLGKALLSNQIPAKVGVLVLNVQTVYAISQAVLLNKPVQSRFLTVANLKEKSAKVVRVNLGMKLQEIIEAVYPGSINIFAGGGIMQSFLADEESVVSPYVNFIAVGNLPNYKESPQCSGCGSCSSYCPIGLPVKKIADLVDQGKLETAVKYGAKECISCGGCSYKCLAGNNLAAKIKRAKEAVTVQT